jgi:diguanylate cyclase
MAALEAPFTLDGVEQSVHASIGIAELRALDEPIDADELLQRADAAMYTGKRRGKSQAVHYEPQRVVRAPGHSRQLPVPG